MQRGQLANTSFFWRSTSCLELLSPRRPIKLLATNECQSGEHILLLDAGGKAQAAGELVVGERQAQCKQRASDLGLCCVFVSGAHEEEVCTAMREAAFRLRRASTERREVKRRGQYGCILSTRDRKTYLIRTECMLAAGLTMAVDLPGGLDDAGGKSEPVGVLAFLRSAKVMTRKRVRSAVDVSSPMVHRTSSAS